jgi:hypothetical protein
VNSRGFVILLVFAVAASIALGLIVERFTAPGMERTFWFAVALAAVIFPAGWYAERRGWVKGVWRAGGDPPPPLTEPPAGGDAAPATRQSGGEPK